MPNHLETFWRGLGELPRSLQRTISAGVPGLPAPPLAAPPAHAPVQYGSNIDHHHDALEAETAIPTLISAASAPELPRDRAGDDGSMSPPRPIAHSATQSVNVLLTSGLAVETAQRAGRPVEAFDAVLISPLVPEGRFIDLEVGDHGLSLRDPAGALLRCQPTCTHCT